MKKNVKLITFFETKYLVVVAKEQLETRMEKFICNNEENEVVKEESEESCSLIFPF